jgi:hypothetical protein
MKRMNLIGMSTVAAGLLIVGCSSNTTTETSGGAASGVKIALGLTPAHATVVSSAINTVLSQGGPFGPVKGFNLPSKVGPIGPGGEFGTEERNCTISGTEVVYREDLSSDDGAVHVYGTETSTVWDSCVDSQSGTYTSRTRDGLRSVTDRFTNIDDFDNVSSADAFSSADNYTDTYESNVTLASSERINASRFSVESYNNDSGTNRITFSLNGTTSYVSHGEAGDLENSSSTLFENFTNTFSTVYGAESTSSTENSWDGFYENKVSGEVVDTAYFNDFVVQIEESFGNPTSSLEVNGEIGLACMGGKVTIATTATILEDQVNYFDDTNSTGSEVLPFSGAMNFSGADSSSLQVVFSTNESNNTSATTTSSSGSETTHSWSEFTDNGVCTIGEDS